MFEADRVVDWRLTLSSLGVAAEFLTNRHGPCPGCGGKDRFRFDNRYGRGTWYCSGGGNPSWGDGFDLLCHVYGWTLSEAFKAVKGSVETIPLTTSRQAVSCTTPLSKTQAYALSIWKRVDRLNHAVCSHPYVKAKGIGWHAGAGRTIASGRVIGKDADCIVVPIREIGTGKVAAVQCINSDGKKQTFGPVKGNAFLCGNDLNPKGEWFVVEGWADAVSIFLEYRNSCVFAAMGKEFDDLTITIVNHYHPQRLVVLGDAP
jgi:phage/plasmid primase-like uncharacterized protein